jgi:predicted AlkP superfamily phosphohydrolase/phosphomutase
MTGMDHRKHGVDGFIYYRMGERIVKKGTVKKFLKCGFRPLFRFLKREGTIKDYPFSMSMVQQKMLWEILAQKGRTVGIINWWWSWPAGEVPGFIVSDRIHYWREKEKDSRINPQERFLVFPEHLSETVMGQVVNPFSLPYEVYTRFMSVDEEMVEKMKNSHYQRHQLMSEFKYLYSMDESVRKVALHCLEEFSQPDLLALYFRGIDIVSHCALKYMPEHRDSEISESEVEQFGDTVHRYYQRMDKIIGELVDRLSDDTTIMLISDHGFAKEPDGRFGHRKTHPPGLFLLCGRNIKQGVRIDGKSLFDVAPTLLYFSNLPVSQEMEGEVLTECLEDSFLKNNPIRFTESYGVPARRIVDSAVDADEAIKERLRALGYIE